MAAVSSAIAERSRKNESAILRAVAATSQKRMAEMMDLSETTLSRMVAQEVPRIAQFLASCGLAVMSEKAPRVEPEILAALQVLAAKGAQNAASPSEFGDNLCAP